MARLIWTKARPTTIVGRETPNVLGTNHDVLFDVLAAEHANVDDEHDVEAVARGGGYIQFGIAGTPPTYTLTEKYGIVSSITPDSTGIIVVNLSFAGLTGITGMADDGAGSFFYKVIAQAIGKPTASTPRIAWARALAALTFQLELNQLNEAVVDGDISFAVMGRIE